MRPGNPARLSIFLTTLSLAAAVLTGATTVLPGPAQAASGPARTSFGIRLADVPVAEAGNPRAQRYIIDHLHPGATIHRQVLVANLSSSADRITVYPDAATIRGGSFIGDGGETRSDLTTWITTSRHSLSLSSHAGAMVTVTIHVPRGASSGERYGVIWAQETNHLLQASGLAVTEINRVGVRIYLSVGPGGAPPSNFAITSLTGTRAAHGLAVVRANVRNTGGRALDLSGYLKLSDGPGGLTDGPYNLAADLTVAPGQSEPVTIISGQQLPDGPWRALIALTSGLTERQSAATIQFPPYGVKARAAAISGNLIVALIALIVVALFAGIATQLIRRNRSSTST